MILGGGLITGNPGGSGSETSTPEYAGTSGTPGPSGGLGGSNKLMLGWAGMDTVGALGLPGGVGMVGVKNWRGDKDTASVKATSVARIILIVFEFWIMSSIVSLPLKGKLLIITKL